MNGWIKGTPTEEGLYLVACKSNKITIGIGRLYKNGIMKSVHYNYIIGRIVAYQKIEPYVEHEAEDNV